MRNIVVLLLCSCALSDQKGPRPVDRTPAEAATPDAKPAPPPNAGLLGKVLTGGKPGSSTGAGGLGTRGSGKGGGGLDTFTGGLGMRGTSGYGGGAGAFGSQLGSFNPAVPPERFTSYGRNGVVLTASDPLSTFSIDVDTASFAISRSYLNRYTLPPASAVRVEEFVNAQTYHYPAPDAGRPFAVAMEAAPHPWEAGHHLLRIGVQASSPELDRPPVHLTFLVDTSGSMRAQNKLPLAKRAMKELVKNLGEEDRIAITTYAGTTSILLPPTRVSDRQTILQAIESLDHGGGTAMESGMQAAYELALSTLEPGTENRVVLLSDGDANIGATSHEQILTSLERYAKQGISLSTIGFGQGSYRDSLMEQLANKGDGNYYYIVSFSEARKVFGTHLAGTLQTIARDVKIQVVFEPDSVLSYRLIGYENRAIDDNDFHNDKVDAGEIGTGHSITALYDLILRDHPTKNIATVHVRSKAPGPDAPSVERSTPLPTSALHADFSAASPDFKVATGAASFAEKLRGSPHLAEVDYDTLIHLIEAADRGEDDDLIQLLHRARSLSQTNDLARR